MVLLIVPPFHSVERPSLGAHIVQASLKKQGINAEVLYLNLIFAARIGFESYKIVCESQTSLFLGESIFAPWDMSESSFKHIEDKIQIEDEVIKKIVADFREEVSSILIEKEYSIVGCSSMFQQNNASIFCLRESKRVKPNAVTVMGGGGMAEKHADGIKILLENHYPNVVNYIFSGESEHLFVEKIKSNELSNECFQKIYRPEEQVNMDELPQVNYSDFFKQASQCDVGITPSTIWLPVESSRGCWWGMKSHCTFCALSDTEIIYRKKSAKNTILDIENMTNQGLSKKVVFVDSILPKNHLKEVLSNFQGKGISFYMEQKVPISFDDAKLMSSSGVVGIQPGIESFSRDLLKRMKKGIHPFQNIELLRFCRIFNISVEYNFLHGIPLEQPQEYLKMLDIVPLLEHLNAPAALSEISLERYSPYFDYPEEYGIKNIRGHSNYKHCYPYYKGIEDIYCCFTGEYSYLASLHPKIFKSLEKEVNNWMGSWNFSRAELTLSKIDENLYTIKDSRKIGIKKWQSITRAQACSCLFNNKSGDNNQKWAIANKLALIVDDIYVPLVTCDSELYQELING